MAFGTALLRNQKRSLQGAAQSREEEATKLKEYLRGAQRSLEVARIIELSIQVDLKMSREANEKLQQKRAGTPREIASYRATPGIWRGQNVL